MAKLQMSKHDNFAINLFTCDKDEVSWADQRLPAPTDHVIKRLKMGGKRQCRDDIGRSRRLNIRFLTDLCAFGAYNRGSEKTLNV